MGWVSYFEDIADRLTDDLNRYRESLSREKAGSPEVRRQAEALLAACETALAEIRSHLELATDPHFDMAYKITQLDREKAELTRDISNLERKRANVITEIERLQSEGGDLRSDIKHLKRQIALANRDFERLVAANPEAAFELYSSDEQLRAHKPQE